MRRGVVRAAQLLLTAATATFGAVVVFSAVAVSAAPAEIAVPLGAHTFGKVTAPTATVARASADQIGYMEPGQGAHYGPMSFDVTANGTVWVLDEVNDRILAWEPGRPGRFSRSVAVPAAAIDFAVAPSGTIYVTATGPSAVSPTRLALYALGPTGNVLWRAPVNTDYAGGALRFGPDGVLYQVDFNVWRPLTTPAGRALPLEQQVALPAGAQPVVQGRVVTEPISQYELRIRLLDGNGQLVRSWRITSATPIGDTSGLLAMLGNDPVVPIRVYERERADGTMPYEVMVLRLTPSGASVKLSLPYTWWADSPITSVRLGPNGSMYQMWLSRAEGVTVVRYALAAAPAPTTSPTGGAVVPTPAPTAATPEATAVRTTPAQSDTQQRWPWVLGFGLLGLVVLLAGSWLIWRRRHPPLPPQAALVDWPPTVAPDSETEAVPADGQTVEFEPVHGGRRS